MTYPHAQSRRRLLMITAAATLALAGCDDGPEPMPPGAPELRVETFLTDLGRPWDMAFLPDGTMLLTERSGGILAVDTVSGERRTLLERPSDLSPVGQSGLLGVAVDPDFATNRFVYAYLASNRDGPRDNRVRRFTLSEDGAALTEDRDILTGITISAQGGHSGGRIRFGPDGQLWITTGDTHQGTVPQDPTELGGKVLRVTRDGEPSEGNPAPPEGGRPEIIFTGVRNPQGLTFRPGSGEAFICEHGPSVDDEVTRIALGGNGGWNPDDGQGGYTGYSGALMSDPSIPGVVAPSFVLSSSQGMSGCDFLTGAQWGAWDGKLLIGLLSGQRGLVVPLDEAGTGTTGPAIEVLTEGRRLRAIVQGPDGHVYVAIDEDPGTLLRLRAD